MTSGTNHSQKSFMPNNQQSYANEPGGLDDELNDMDDTPRRIPVVSAPPLEVASLPHRRKRRLALPVMIVLVLLALFIGLGSYVEQQWASAAPGQTPTAQATTPTGPFVQLPFSASQLNSLLHLTGYMKYKQLAAMYVARMSLDVELGQLIMVEYNDTTYSSDLDTMVNKLHAGGVIMYEFQMQTFNQTKRDIAQMQQRATFPLLISTDEEGGPYVHRLKNIYGLRMSATDIYNTGDLNVATQQGAKAARDLLALGINENLAPDVDVNLVNGYDMVTRTFGNDPASVIKFAGAYLRALQGAGVVGTIKHFPGLGAAVPDAHAVLPVVNRTKEQIYASELAPFKYFIQSRNALDNPGVIMPTDILMPAIDPNLPAELSPIFMTDILRKQFGYDGVALTDALYMKGITDKWSMPQAAVMALKAGNDMLLGPNGAAQTIEMLNAIKQALKDGTLTKARIDEAATRIIALKMQYRLMPAIPPQN
jgi:beta-N-acetylhexosaminidase